MRVLASLPAPRSHGLAAAWVYVATTVFLVAIAISIAAYPGGSALDRSAVGHDALRNFVCDLLHPVALNGAPNPIGARLAPVGMLVFAAGLGALFWHLPAAFPEARSLRVWVRGAGSLSAAGLVLVPLTPTTSHPVLHAAAVLAAAPFAILAGAAASVALARSNVAGGRRLAALGALAALVSAADVVLFAIHCAEGGPVPLALPALQRVASVLLVLWVLAAARLLRRVPP